MIVTPGAAVAVKVTLPDGRSGERTDLLAVLTDPMAFTGAQPVRKVAVAAPRAMLSGAVTIASLCGLAILGYVGAKAGDASPWRGVVRVTLWGAVAMAVTAVIGRFVGAAI